MYKLLSHRETYHNDRRWFPGHMNKGLKQMQQKLKNIDCIIEVHDARVPLSGRHADFNNVLLGLKPHIFVLNKMDLADMRYKEAILSQLNKEGISNILFTNFTNQMCKGMKQILPLATNLIKNSDRFNRAEKEDYTLMIIGVPNVGKSSLINRLRNLHLHKSNATAVGAIAGITRSVLTRIKISEEPNVYLIDTPGILMPNVTDIHAGLKLALVGCLQDHLIGPEVLADYLLFWLNKHNRFEYVEYLGLPEPSDDILHVLVFITAKYKKTLKIKNFDGRVIVKPNLKYAAEYLISSFRKGMLGTFCLDEDLMQLTLKENTTEMHSR